MLRDLGPLLVGFWVRVESTGASTQFYDKFTIRHCIARIFKVLWQLSGHRERLVRFSNGADDSEGLLFVRFVNLLVNDITYLLDEAMTKLAAIHERESNPPSTTADDQSDDHRRQEQQCQSCIQLGFETLHLLQYLTLAIREPFLRAEVVDRLAGMLDLKLALLVGPKCRGLRVSGAAEKFQFYPRTWLAELVRIYMNLGDQDAFVRAVARDERSFDAATFARASSILLRTNTMGSVETDQFDRLLARIAAAIEEERHRETVLGDIPEEFLGKQIAVCRSLLLYQIR